MSPFHFQGSDCFLGALPVSCSGSSFANDYGNHMDKLERSVDELSFGVSQVLAVTIEHNKNLDKHWAEQKVQNEKLHKELSKLNQEVEEQNSMLKTILASLEK
jgi:hypothetical protein